MALKDYNSFANSISFYAQFTFTDDILKFYIQNVNLPDLTYGLTQLQKSGDIFHILGESKERTPVNLNFIIDENFEVYTTLIDLQEKYRNEFESMDSFEIYLQNNKNVSILKWVFTDVFFSSILGPEMSTTEAETEIFVATEMYYSDFTIERL